MIEEGAKLYAETIAAAVKAAQELPVKSNKIKELENQLFKISTKK